MPTGLEVQSWLSRVEYIGKSILITEAFRVLPE
jgi:hypothetical protein